MDYSTGLGLSPGIIMAYMFSIWLNVQPGLNITKVQNVAMKWSTFHNSPLIIHCTKDSKKSLLHTISLNSIHNSENKVRKFDQIHLRTIITTNVHRANLK